MKQNIPVRNHGNSPFQEHISALLSRWLTAAVTLSCFVLARPTPTVLGVLTQQITGAAAAWAGQVPGEPGPSAQPGSNLSLLKCGEANIIAPEMGQCNIKTNRREKRMNITELKRKNKHLFSPS